LAADRVFQASGDAEVERPIALAAVVLTPRHFVGVGSEVAPREMMVSADLRAAEAAEGLSA
jgi:hypothetical protein